MRIKIITSERIKNKFAGEAIKEYTKRLTRYCKVKLSATNNIAKEIKGNTYLIKISSNGKMLTSEELAEKISSLGVRGNSHITFVYDNEHHIEDADFNLKISDMDIASDLLLIILYEQIYRAYRIINNEPYHR
ncbi:MAG: 23S rRNA (pseudouridine(1915)-N(3))-methyltransferase RlmH [Caldicoprobacterales bacterium]